MKQFVLIVTLSIAFTLQGKAAEKFTCDDLDELSSTLIEISTTLEQAGSIREGDDVDTGLRDIIDGLKMIASVENESDLNDSVDRMEQGWEDMDGTSLYDGLIGVETSLERLIKRDCN